MLKWLCARLKNRGESCMALSEEQQQALSEGRTATSTTRRSSIPDLEEILFEPLPVLDHGFVRVVDYMGDDSAIVQAARVSYGKGTKQISKDRGLIHYLMRHRHSTPFEMCEIKCHVKLPVFVARQWIRHRTANVNEYSARYSILGKEFYVPSEANLAPQATQNQQGREGSLSPEEAQQVLETLREDSLQSYRHYEEMMNCTEKGEILDPSKSGIARELARMALPTNFYTEWYWKIDLHNFMHFLSLRADGHAQYEIRVYAEALLEVLKRWVPLTYEAFCKYRLKAASLSSDALNVVQRLLRGEAVCRQETEISPREWRELMALLKLDEDAKPIARQV